MYTYAYACLYTKILAAVGITNNFHLIMLECVFRKKTRKSEALQTGNFQIEMADSDFRKLDTFFEFSSLLSYFPR